MLTDPGRVCSRPVHISLHSVRGSSWACSSSRAAARRTSRATSRRRCRDAGWDVTVLSGSLTPARPPGRRGRFYRGLDVRPVDMTRGAERARPAAPPTPPLHPSYEDRPGAPDRVFARLDDADAEHQVAAWARALQSAGAADADVLHLHHLTPLNEAAAPRRARRARRRPPARHRAADARGDRARPGALAVRARRGPSGCATGRPRCERLIVLSETQIERAAARCWALDRRPLRAGPQRLRPARRSRPRHVDHAALWRRMLVDEPRGWAPGEEPGIGALRGAPTWRPSTDDGRPSCSTSAASPRSSACRC